MARDGEGWHVNCGAMRHDSRIKKRRGKPSAGWLCFGFGMRETGTSNARLGRGTMDKRAMTSPGLEEKCTSRSANV